MTRSTFIRFLILPVIAFAQCAAAATVHVPADAPTIQDAIDTATDGDEIVVAPGTYAEIIDYQGKTLTVRSSGGAAVTIIDASTVVDPGSGTPVVRIESGVQTGTSLEGFTLTGGGGDRTEFGDPVGGAVFCGTNTTFEMRSCLVTANHGVVAGAGIFVVEGTLRVLDCQFVNNSSSVGGGAIYGYDGGILHVERSHFESNELLAANGTGGAIWWSDGSVTLLESDFVANGTHRNDSSGGGACYLSGDTSGEIARCRFVGNYLGAGGYGGALFISSFTAFTVRSCLFVGNEAGIDGGAIRVESDDVHIISSTLACNQAGERGGGIQAINSSSSISNCILYGNEDAGGIDASAQMHGSASVTYSLVQGGLAGTGNIDGDPLFVNVDGEDGTLGTLDDDVRLSAGSPAIDAGDSLTWVNVLDAVDLDGAPRLVDDPSAVDTGVAVYGLTIDCGAYEVQAGTSIDGACCVGDGCAVIGEAACLAIGGTFAGTGTTCADIACTAPCLGDLDDDGSVGFSDLVVLLSAWGLCPG